MPFLAFAAAHNRKVHQKAVRDHTTFGNQIRQKKKRDGKTMDGACKKGKTTEGLQYAYLGFSAKALSSS